MRTVSHIGNVADKEILLSLAVMLFGLIPYLILSPLSQTVQMDRGIASGIAVTSVMAGSVCNAAARLLLPTAADKVGRTICLKGVLAVIVLATPFFDNSTGACDYCVW